MIKDKIICIDLDNTLINTPLSLVKLHNKLNPNNQYIYTNNIDWKFRPIINSDEELSELFELFDNKDFYGDTLVVYPDAIEVINRLSEDNKVYIVSKHMESRKPLTKAWISKVMPKVEIVFVDNFEDKGKLFENCYAVVDDRVDSLYSFRNNVIKICFGNFQWNQDWNGMRCMSWKDVMLSLNTIYYFKYIYPNNKVTFKQEYKCEWKGDSNETK